MKLFEVEIVYQNIESGGNRRFVYSVNLWARNYPEAVEKGIKKLGSNVDGHIYSVSATRIFVSR